jgi:hypothetical protein
MITEYTNRVLSARGMHASARCLIYRCPVRTCLRHPNLYITVHFLSCLVLFFVLSSFSVELTFFLLSTSLARGLFRCHVLGILTWREQASLLLRTRHEQLIHCQRAVRVVRRICRSSLSVISPRVEGTDAHSICLGVSCPSQLLHCIRPLVSVRSR